MRPFFHYGKNECSYFNFSPAFLSTREMANVRRMESGGRDRESEITLQETEDGNPMCGKGELQLQHAFGGFGGMEQGIRNCR